MEVKKQTKKHPKRPAWFEDFYENDYKPFQIVTLNKFKELNDLKKDMSELKTIVMDIKNMLTSIVKYNNLKTHE